MKLVSFFFFLNDTVESSETRREPAVNAAWWSSWEGWKLRYDSSVILGYGTVIISERIICLSAIAICDPCFIIDEHKLKC